MRWLWRLLFEPAFDKAVRHLSSPNATCREMALWTLTRLRDPRALPHFVDALQDPDPMCRLHAVVGLHYQSDRNVVGPLREYVKREPDAFNRLLARDALIGFGDLQQIAEMGEDIERVDAQDFYDWDDAPGWAECIGSHGDAVTDLGPRAGTHSLPGPPPAAHAACFDETGGSPPRPNHLRQ